MRTSQIRLSMELMDAARCSKICALDAKTFGEDIDKYCSANEAQYYLSINVWLGILDDAFGRAARYRVTQYIWENGLRKAIDLSCRTADSIISRLSGDNAEVSEEVVQWESLFPMTDIRVLLMCLRFLKRFTVDASASLQAASYQKFISIQEKLNWRRAARSRSKDPDVTMPMNRWVPSVAYWMDLLLCGTMSKVKNEFGSFGNGACSDGRTMLEKIQQYATYSYNREGCILYPLLAANRSVPEYDPKVIEVMGVPKSHKAYRIIAPETAKGSYEQQRLRKAIIANIKSTCPNWWPYLDVESQDRQKDRAYIGSREGTFCTYDLSGASDSIALHWMYQVMCWYPETDTHELFNEILRYRAPKVKVDGSTLTLSSFLTSGNACTFVMETCFFWSLAMVAREFHYEWCNEWCEIPSVFGDDMIVDSRCQGELETILEDFDLVINYEKSFTAGDYRESCGVEFWRGHPVSNRYWPRARILTTKKPTSSDYASLVSLQHKVYDKYPTAANFIEEAVLYWWPTATKSYPGLLDIEESTDLWSVFYSKKEKRAPFGAYWHDDCPKFPVDAPEWMYREAHSGLRVSKAKGEQSYDALSPEAKDLLETWLYAEYLMYGPQYSCPLDELLGVTEPRDRAVYVRQPEVAVALLT